MRRAKHSALLLILAAGLLLPGALGTAAAAPPMLAASTFDAGAEGWAVAGDAITPAWHGAGGNPGGYLSAIDEVGGDTWYWVAPAKFLGDKSAAYGGALRFDLQQSRLEDPFAELDLVLEGGGLKLSYDTPYDPATIWTSYTVILNEEVVWWRHGDEITRATEADLRAALADLTSLRIRGEFQNGEDIGGLDNVLLRGPASDLVRIPGTAVIYFANRFDITVPPLGGDLTGFPLGRNCPIGPCDDFLEETFPLAFRIRPGATVTVAAYGGMDYYGSTQPSVGPEGDQGPGDANIRSLGGISGYAGPEGALAGVFLSDTNPRDATPPDALNFGPDGLGTGFTSLSPVLGQVFFIGDGLTGTGMGTRQSFIAPAGATRFFLGIPDAFSFWGEPGAYDDNKGAFYAQVSGVLRPAGYLPVMRK